MTDATPPVPAPRRTGCPPCSCSPCSAARSLPTASTGVPATSVGTATTCTQDPAAVAPPAGLELPAWPQPVSRSRRPAQSPALVRPAAVEAALAKGLRDKTLGKHVVAAVGDLGGDGAVWTHDDDQFLPASITKVLTSTAALAALGPDTTFTTRVVAGANPREVVLVGGGDPYLSSKPLTPEEQATTYPERADVVTLARETARALAGRKRVRVLYDDSLFTGPTNNPKWRADYVPDDIVTPITALWVDRGASPTGFGRSDDPSLDRGRDVRQRAAAGGREGRRRADREASPHPARPSSRASRAHRSPRSSSTSSTSATTRRPRCWPTTSAWRSVATAPSSVARPACSAPSSRSASRPGPTSCTTARASRATTGSRRPPCCRSSRSPHAPTIPSSAR